MGQIVILGTINGLHANLASEAMAWMHAKMWGLNEFRMYHIPMTAFTNGTDLEITPALKTHMITPGPVEWGNATWSHAFPDDGDETISALQVAETIGAVPVTFFAEFAPAKPEHIPTRFTPILAANSALYPDIQEWTSRGFEEAIPQALSPDARAINFGGKVGILMREEWYGAFLRAFFTFQRFPGSKPHLAAVIKAVREIADAPDDHVVVVPIDLEAPFVGSRWGDHVWSILFDEIHRLGLQWVFSPVSAHLDRFAGCAVDTARPHREMGGKWFNFDAQREFDRVLRELQPTSNWGLKMKMIASVSDVFAAIGIKFMEGRKRTLLPAVNLSGKEIQIPISYNPAVVWIQLAAFNALKQGTSFLAQLKEIRNQDDYLVHLFVSWAEREGL